MLEELQSDRFEQPVSGIFSDPIQRAVIRMYCALGEVDRIDLWANCDTGEAVVLSNLLPRLSKQEHERVIEPANARLREFTNQMFNSPLDAV